VFFTSKFVGALLVSRNGGVVISEMCRDVLAKNIQPCLRHLFQSENGCLLHKQYIEVTDCGRNNIRVWSNSQRRSNAVSELSDMEYSNVMCSVELLCLIFYQIC
jgi:hypothetical protein